MNMKLIKYRYGIIAFFCLATTGAFSLFGMRYTASRHALHVKNLERCVCLMAGGNLKPNLALPQI